VVFNFRKFLLYGVKLLTMGHGSKFKSDVPSHGKIPAYSNGSLIRMDKSALCKFCDLCLVQSNCFQCVASTESASNAIRFVSCVRAFPRLYTQDVHFVQISDKNVRFYLNKD